MSCVSGKLDILLGLVWFGREFLNNFEFVRNFFAKKAIKSSKGPKRQKKKKKDKKSTKKAQKWEKKGEKGKKTPRPGLEPGSSG